MPGQHIPLFFQAGAGTSVALGIPVKLASDLVAVRRATIYWQQIEQCTLVLVGLVLSLPHAKNTLDTYGPDRGRPGRVNPRRLRCRHHCPAGTPTNSIEAIKQRRGSRPVERSDVVVELELVRVRAAPHVGALECPLSCGNT
jgi:hypothetical protein